jgi:hypothetical protein
MVLVIFGFEGMFLVGLTPRPVPWLDRTGEVNDSCCVRYGLPCATMLDIPDRWKIDPPINQ